VAAQADQSRRAVRAGAIFGVLVLARVLGGSPDGSWSASPWFLPAILSHDVLVALVFWAIDQASFRAKWLWLAYIVVVALAAINVPVVRALGTSLTVPMVRAARGPILDSIRVYVTWFNVLSIALVLTAAAFLPSLLRATSRRTRRLALVCGAAMLVLAPIAKSRMTTPVAERNVITALLSSLWPRVATSVSERRNDWRASPFQTATPDSAVDYRASGKGFNVLLIVLESTGAQYLKPYGAVDDPMPAITELASRSLLVDGTYSPYPESIRAFYSLGCAEPPAFDVSAEQLAASACVSLPIQLGKLGYRTALYHSGRFAYLGMTEMMALMQFETGVDAGGISGRVESSFGVDEPSTVTKALEWIDRQDGRPFFLTYLPTAGHHPYASSGKGPFPQTDDLSAFKNAIHEGDQAIATLLSGLRTRGLDSRTIVIVTGDHGEAFGQHAGNFAHSFYIYDENIRVPLLFHVPGRAPHRMNRISSLTDLAPTLLDIIGAPAMQGVDGSSLIDGPARMALFFTDYAVGRLGLRDGCLKYLFEVEAQRSQLYNVCDDPREQTDVSGRMPDRLASYRERLESWAAARREAVLKPSRGNGR
jgi:phosphoglycerol transferase MdoB-like AlkP superfamily enzyme